MLCYHHVVDVSDDPLYLCVHPDRFRAQIERLGLIADIVPLAAIGERGTPRSSRAGVIHNEVIGSPWWPRGDWSPW